MCLTIGRLIRITVDERLVGHKVLMILAESSKVIMSLIIVTVVSLTSVTLIKLITVKDGQVVPPLISLIRLSWEISLKGF